MPVAEPSRLLLLASLLLAHAGPHQSHASAGRVASTATMSVSRMAHTASVLSDGRVLVAGGFTSEENVSRSAELFDPATNSFSPTGSLGAARAGHVAVLLGDGKVLIAGGVGPGWTFLSSAELYDPATGRFSRTRDMTEARESHAAVRLRDGRVLIVGGHRGRRADITLYASAETYDATAGTFTRVGEMRVRRHKHDAVMLADGRVLITGGSDERDSDGVYVSTELFDPTTGTFALGPSMRRGRYKHNGSSVLLPNGDVLIAGGAAQAEAYDPRRGTFTLVEGDGPLTGQFSAVALLGTGEVLITGGYGPQSGPRPAAWLYRP